MPRYTINGVEVAVNPITAATPPNLATIAIVNADPLVNKEAIKRAKEAAPGGGGGGGGTKMLVVGVGVVAALAWAWSKHKAKPAG